MGSERFSSNGVRSVTSSAPSLRRCQLLMLIILCVSIKDILGTLEEWWTYKGISGPNSWGLVNPSWSQCNKGHRQSPVNVQLDKLLFEPQLGDVQFNTHSVNGVLQNTGNLLVFRVEENFIPQVNISGGPLAHRYQFEEILIHYGMEDNQGSEHQINHKTFPGEIQLYGFNKELYHNMSEAQQQPQGIVAISVMLQIGDTSQCTRELRLITSAFTKIKYRGSTFPIHQLSPSSLLPNSGDYFTYEGSTTYPGCWETVQWIVFKEPIYISKQEMYALRHLVTGSQLDLEQEPLGNNARPIQPLYARTIRTNINPNKHVAEGETK